MQCSTSPTLAFQTQSIACRCCRGITNGIDTKEWDPSTDPHLPVAARYSSSSVTEGKAAAKALFRQQHGLHPTPNTPLVAFVGRLSSQKGADVLLAALPHMLSSSSTEAANSHNSSVPMEDGQVVPAVHGDAVEHSRCQIALLGAGQPSAAWCASHVACLGTTAMLCLVHEDPACRHEKCDNLCMWRPLHVTLSAMMLYVNHIRCSWTRQPLLINASQIAAGTQQLHHW